MRPVPIGAAKQVADRYEYDQVIIVARKVGDGGGEHVTTYGRMREHCEAAGKIGNFFKYKLMGWLEETRHQDDDSLAERYAGEIETLSRERPRDDCTEGLEFAAEVLRGKVRRLAAPSRPPADPYTLGQPVQVKRLVPGVHSDLQRTERASRDLHHRVMLRSRKNATPHLLHCERGPGPETDLASFSQQRVARRGPLG